MLTLFGSCPIGALTPFVTKLEEGQWCYAFGGNLSYNNQREPYEITNEHLKTFGVKVVSPTLDPLMLECLKCEERFMVLRWADGNLPKQWWICRNGCNQQDAA